MGMSQRFLLTDYKILDKNQKRAIRKITTIDVSSEAMGKNGYRHFMEKEIYEQPTAILNTLDGRIGGEDVLENIFGQGSNELLAKVERIQIVAAGTSLHAGRVAANWFSAIANLPTQIDYASEYRYKNPYVDKNTLLLTISQSGETADTLGALRYAKERNYLGSLTICNVPTSSLARESDFVLVDQRRARNRRCLHQSLYNATNRLDVAYFVTWQKQET